MGCIECELFIWLPRHKKRWRHINACDHMDVPGYGGDIYDVVPSLKIESHIISGI